MEYHADQRISDIRDLLKASPRGLSISEIADRLGLRRNIVSRDLKYLQRLGQVEMRSIGTSKVYTYTAKIPVSGILDLSSDMILVLDNNHEIIDVNEPLLRMTRKGSEEFIGKKIEDLHDPLLSPLRNLDYDTDSVEQVTAWIPVADDPRAIRHFRVKHVPTIFEDTTRGSLLYIEDISEQVRYRDALRLSEAHYKAIVEAQKELIFRTLPDGTIIFTNRMFKEIFDGQEDFLGRSFGSFLPEDEWQRFQSGLACLTRDEPSISLKTRIETSCGLRDYSFTIYAIWEEDGRLAAFQGIGRDITPELVAQKKMARYTQCLEFLYSKSQAFLESSSYADIFRNISTGIRELVPSAVVMMFSYDSSAEVLTMQSMRNEQGEDLIKKIFPGGNLKIPLPSSLLAGEGPFAEVGKGRLSRLENHQVQPLIGNETFTKVREVIGERSFYAMIMSWEGLMVGSVVIAIPTASEIADRTLVETVIRIGVLSLERELSHESLSLSENRFRLIAETAPLPIAILSENGAYLFLNQKFTETFGYTLEDLPDGRRWFLQAFPETQDMQMARALWMEDLAKSKPGEIRPRQFTVRCRNGSFKSVIFRPVTLLDGAQLVVYEDVTEVEEADKVRNLLAEIVRSSHDGIIGMTMAGKIQTWNPGAERIYGYTAAETLGKDISLIMPEALLHEKDMLLSRTAKGEFITGFETRRKRKDGRLIDVSVTISPIFDKNNRIIGTSTIVRDITSKKAQERIQELESRYRDLVDTINVGVYRSTGDSEGRFIWGNTSLVRILGYTSLESIQEVPVAQFFIHVHGRDELLHELREKGFVRNRELLLKKADGHVAHVLVTALATFDESGDISYINGIIEDITDQRVLARKLASLEHSVKELGRGPVS
jgi:PAS domain S-box-containing protein